VGKSKDVDADGTVEFGSGPERDTDSVERGEVSTERGPLEDVNILWNGRNGNAEPVRDSEGKIVKNNVSATLSSVK
jgi:hypothetical protein